MTLVSRSASIGFFKTARKRLIVLALIAVVVSFLAWPDPDRDLAACASCDLVVTADDIGHVSFGPDARQILIGTTQIVYLHDAQNGALLSRLWAVGYDERSAPTFSPDGRHFVTTPLSEAILWDLDTGLQQIVFTVDAPRGRITSIAFSADARRLVTAGEDNTARIWDTTSARPRSAWFAPIERRGPIRTLIGHTNAVEGVALSVDERRVLTMSRLDHTARLWDADSGQQIAVFSSGRSEMGQAIFSPDGRRVLTLTGEQIRLWDAADGRPLLSHDAASVFQQFRKATFSPDARRIAAVGGSSTPHISVWDADTGQVLLSTDGRSSTMRARSSFLTDAQFSPDARRLVTTSHDGNVELWEVGTGRELVALPGPSVSASRPVFSPDGRRLAVSFFHDSVKIWQLLDGAPYHDPNAATFVRSEVPDIREWAAGRYHVARRALGSSP